MFEHYIPILDELQGEPTQKLLEQIVQEFRPLQAHMKLRYEQYKASEQGIAIFSRGFEQKDKVNNQLNNDFFSEVIDTKVGYLLGLPIACSFESENQAAKERIDAFLTLNNSHDKDLDAGKYASICGYGARLLYHDTEGRERMMNVLPYEAIFLSRESIAEPSYAMRMYPTKKRKGDEFEDALRVEFYNADEIILFEGEAEEKLQEIGRKPNLYGAVPLIGIENNTELQGDLDKVMSLIEGYDRTLSDVNSEIEQFRLAYMIFKGVMVDEEVIQMLKKTGALEIPEEGDASFLTKQLDGTLIEAHLDRLEKNINRFAKHVNFTEAFGSGTVTGPAMKYKLFMLETKAAMLELKITTALRRQFQLLFHAWKLRANEQLSHLDMTFQFTRNVPANLLDEAQTQAQLKGLVSEETRLSLASFIGNPSEELQKMQDEQADAVNLYMTGGGMNAGTGLGMAPATDPAAGAES